MKLCSKDEVDISVACSCLKINHKWVDDLVKRLQSVI